MTLRQASFLALKIGAIAASSGLILALSFYISIRMVIFGNAIDVPDLRGRTAEQTGELLSGGGLTIETVEERFDPRVPAGAIISQTPAAGAVTKRNRKIRVVVSLGTEVLTVPDFTGQTERKAIAMALVDRALRWEELGEDNTGAPAQDQEFVLYHSDNVQATGFVEHIKLPHYVDFQSELELVRRIRREALEAQDAQEAAE